MLVIQENLQLIEYLAYSLPSKLGMEFLLI